MPLAPRTTQHEAVHRSEVTTLLTRCSAGEQDAFQRLITLVYDDLRRIAHRRLRGEHTGHTLDTTAVVHEAYLRLAERPDATWQDRAHFFAVAARVIRHVLVDHARKRQSVKRGGDVIRVPLHEGLAGEATRMVDFLAIEEALKRLEKLDARLVRVVECRFFAGLDVAETAEVLASSRRTVERDWTRAKAYLYRSLSDESLSVH
jgi:RNA polymerase sigma factor (TIGR02999 family)